MKINIIFLFFVLSIFPKNQIEKFISNKNKFLEFKKNMTDSEWDYFEPRKKYIDRLPIKSSKDYFTGADMIIRGSILRKKFSWNESEIIKLEKFLSIADDLELSKYFSLNEEILFSMNSKKSIGAILKLVKEDENWRIKSDPVFFAYLNNKASIEEKIFYKKNKSLFFRKESGIELIQFLNESVSN